MKKMWKKIITAGMALALATGLSACELGGNGMNAKDASYYVQGYIDEAYMGKYDKAFLEFMDITEDDADKLYQDGLDTETDFFISYFGLDEDFEENPIEISEELRTQIRDTYKDIYSKSKYSVGEASKMENGSYSVPVKVQPMDVIQKMEDGFEAYLEQFVPSYTNEELNAMTDEAYDTYLESVIDFYNNQYGQKMVEFFQQQAADVGYLTEKNAVIQVESTEEDNTTTWYLNEDNTVLFDEYVIYYPSYSNYTA